MTKNETYVCSVCGSEYNRLLYKVNCEKSHKVIYLPILRADVDRIMQFIYKYYNEDEDKLPTNMLNIFHSVMGLKDNVETLPYNFEDIEEE
jgi:hypothetical protein